jgi:hypothetical protein
MEKDTAKLLALYHEGYEVAEQLITTGAFRILRRDENHTDRIDLPS